MSVQLFTISSQPFVEQSISFHSPDVNEDSASERVERQQCVCVKVNNRASRDGGLSERENAGDEDIFIFISVPVSFASSISLNVSEAQNIGEELHYLGMSDGKSSMLAGSMSSP